MGWHAYFVLHPEEKDKEKKEFYGFKAGYAPPKEGQDVIRPFINKLLDMANNLKFRKSFGNTFQNELKEVIQDIKESTKRGKYCSHLLRPISRVRTDTGRLDRRTRTRYRFLYLRYSKMTKMYL